MMDVTCDLEQGWQECWNKNCKEHSEMIDNKGFTPDEETLRNAAPDMYEALKGLLAEFRGLDLPYGSSAYLKASNAIAKAEGK